MISRERAGMCMSIVFALILFFTFSSLSPSLKVVFSFWCKNKTFACASPMLINMEYYGAGDLALGVFLEQHFANEIRCPSAGCTEPYVGKREKEIRKEI